MKSSFKFTAEKLKIAGGSIDRAFSVEEDENGGLFSGFEPS